MSFTDLFKGENAVLNIMLLIAIAGTLSQSFAPGLLDPIAGFISEPLKTILNVYVLMFFMYTIVGEEKDASAILKKLMPIMMVIIVAGTFFDLGISTAWYLSLIILAPLLGKAARNLVQGGIVGLGKKWSSGKTGDIFGAMSAPEKKDDKAASHNWDRTGVNQMVQINDALINMREQVLEFNQTHDDFEEESRALAGIFRR